MSPSRQHESPLARTRVAFGRAVSGDLLSFALFLALSLVVAGCDRNIEPFEPGEEPKAPDLARIFPGPPGGGMETGDPSAGGRGAAERAMADDASGAPARGAFPPSRSEGVGGSAASNAPSGEAPSITGQVELPAALAGVKPAQGVLFVIARPQGMTGGPPLAVVRIADPTFPVAFAIGPGDVMIPTMQFAGPISLTARLDADGNAMTRGEGDLASDEASGLEPGATGVALVLGPQR